MADVVESVDLQDLIAARHAFARSRRRRDDLWVALTALVAALAALPLAQSSWHGPEVASVLAVSATALLAGQRWAVALVVIAELLLVPTVWPRAFATAGGALPAQLAALGAMIAIVPGLLAMRRAAAALVLVTGRPRTQRTCRRFHAALVGTALVATVLPLF